MKTNVKIKIYGREEGKVDLIIKSFSRTFEFDESIVSDIKFKCRDYLQIGTESILIENVYCNGIKMKDFDEIKGKSSPFNRFGSIEYEAILNYRPSSLLLI